MTTSPPAKTGPRDVFLQLFVIIMLYLAAVNLGTALFQLINSYFPDPLAEGGYYPYYFDRLRWAMAFLLIAYPLYIWVNWLSEKELKKTPEKRELKIRKWLITFTIFATGVIMVVDLVTLLYNFLAGELTLRFVLKVFAVLFVAASVGGYNLYALKRKEFERTEPKVKIFAVVMTAVVLASLVVGFLVAGLPKDTRARKFDDRRVSDLQNIQWQVINFWQNKNRLPTALNDLQDPISGFVSPSDPETNASYVYRVKGDLSFELCATFKTEGTQSGYGGKYPCAGRYCAVPYPADGFDNWQHGTGEVCFERTIDPELYPPAVPVKD